MLTATDQKLQKSYKKVILPTYYCNVSSLRALLLLLQLYTVTSPEWVIASFSWFLWFLICRRLQYLIFKLQFLYLYLQFFTRFEYIVILHRKKGKGFPYSLPSVGPRADQCVRAVSPQVTISHPPGGRLPLLQSCPWVHFVWPNPTQHISWLTKPNPTHCKRKKMDQTRPNPIQLAMQLATHHSHHP